MKAIRSFSLTILTAGLLLSVSAQAIHHPFLPKTSFAEHAKNMLSVVKTANYPAVVTNALAAIQAQATNRNMAIAGSVAALVIVAASAYNTLWWMHHLNSKAFAGTPHAQAARENADQFLFKKLASCIGYAV